MVLIDDEKLNDKQHVDIALREYHIDSKTKDVVIGEEGNERSHYEENFCNLFEYHHAQFSYVFRRVQYGKQSVRKRRNE